MPSKAPIVPGELDFAADGTPVSPRFGDVYHSAAGGPEQADAVFLEGGALAARWSGRERFVVLETGFGLGINFLATWAAWREDPRRPRHLHFVSIEKHPLSRADLERAHARWPGLARLSRALLERWPLPLPGAHRLPFDDAGITLTLFFGDAWEVVPQIEARVDAFFLDGFAPARNAEMWAPALFKALARLAVPEASLATWSVAGPVREALAQAGFETRKAPGFGTKRDRLEGRYRPGWARHAEAARPAPPAPDAATERRAMVLGAGLAGTAVAHALARRGWEVELVERHARPAQEASGNPAGVFQPILSADDNHAARLTRAGLLLALGAWTDLEREGHGPGHTECGVIRVAREAAHEARQRAAIETLASPEGWARFVDRDEACALAGARVASGGWWFPRGGWIRPAALCAAWLAAAPTVRVRLGLEAAGLAHLDGQWRLLAADGAQIARAPVAVLACGSAVGALAGAPALGLRRVRGQLTLLPAGSLPDLPRVVAREGYVTPAVEGAHVVGATYDFEDESLEPHAAGHAGNLARLARLLPGVAPALDPTRLAGRAAFRSVAPDRLPLVGSLSGAQAAADAAPGLYAALGFGSRGLVWAALAAEVLAGLLEGSPLPLERDLLAAIDPARLARRRRAGPAGRMGRRREDVAE